MGGAAITNVITSSSNGLNPAWPWALGLASYCLQSRGSAGSRAAVAVVMAGTIAWRGVTLASSGSELPK